MNIVFYGLRRCCQRGGHGLSELFSSFSIFVHQGIGLVDGKLLNFSDMVDYRDTSDGATESRYEVVLPL